MVFVGHVEGDIYVVDFSKESSHLKTCLMAKAGVGWLCHRRLAHVGMRNLQSLIKGDHIVGLSDDLLPKIVFVVLALPESNMRSNTR